MDTTEHVTTSDTLARQRRERESTEILSNLALDLCKRPTLRKVLHASIQTTLTAWSGTRPLRRRIADRALSTAQRVFPITAPSAAMAKDIGRLVTLWAQKTNARLTENPAALADQMATPLSAFIQNTDFGELKEVFDRAEDSIVETVRRVMGFIWNTYPAKLGALMSMAHPLCNTAVRSLKEIITPLNGVSPDLLADIILAIAGSIDGRQIGQLINGLMEMARQIHTGSLLQGESGIPQFQKDYTHTLRDIMANIDPELFGKVKVIAAENAEERAHARTTVMEENPALVLDVIARLATIKNPRIRALNRRAQVYGDLPRDSLTQAIVNGLSELDTQTLGETVNVALRVFNQVHAEKPDFFARLLENICMNVDADELKSATQWLKQDLIDGLRPIAGEVFPVLAETMGELYQG